MKRKSVSRALGIFLTGVMTLSSVPVMPVWAENVEGLIEESDIEDANPEGMEEDDEETMEEVDLSDVLVQAGGFKAPERIRTDFAGVYYSTSDSYVDAKNKLNAGLLNWDESIDISEYNPELFMKLFCMFE